MKYSEEVDYYNICSDIAKDIAVINEDARDIIGGYLRDLWRNCCIPTLYAWKIYVPDNDDFYTNEQEKFERNFVAVILILKRFLARPTKLNVSIFFRISQKKIQKEWPDISRMSTAIGHFKKAFPMKNARKNWMIF